MASAHGRALWHAQEKTILNELRTFFKYKGPISRDTDLCAIAGGYNWYRFLDFSFRLEEKLSFEFSDGRNEIGEFESVFDCRSKYKGTVYLLLRKVKAALKRTEESRAAQSPGTSLAAPSARSRIAGEGAKSARQRMRKAIPRKKKAKKTALAH
jgi:hypothetical protein